MPKRKPSKAAVRRDEALTREAWAKADAWARSGASGPWSYCNAPEIADEIAKENAGEDADRRL
jgi:hypothetical protein